MIGHSGCAFELPAPRATADVALKGGAAVVLRRHGNPGGPRILLSHGNGLAADSYYPFWSRFLNDFDLFLFDCRNHGWNSTGDRTYHNPRIFAEDLDTIVPEMGRLFGEKPCVGIFHSLTALVSLLLPSRGAAFEALILFDPPLCKPGMSQWEFETHVEELVRNIRLRATHFRTLDEFVEVMEYSSMFRGLDSRSRLLLAQTTLRRRPDGKGYDLRCPPAYEAQAGEFITAYAALADMESMRCPIKVIGADPTMPYTYLPSFDARLVAKIDYDFIPAAGHFVPLEAPARSHALSVEFLEREALLKRRSGR